MSRSNECSPEMIRAHENALTTVTLSLKDFMMRYDNDRKECAERYRVDRDESREWRSGISMRIDKIDRIMEDISGFIKTARPVYNGMARFIWLIILGALGIIFTIIWNHVSSGK